jgi:hypothetical protein
MIPSKRRIKLSGYRDADEIAKIFASSMVDIAYVDRVVDDAILAIPDDPDLDTEASYEWLRTVINEALQSAGISGVSIELCSDQPNDPSNENGQNSISQDSGSVEKGESLWSPPQFSLRSVIIAVTALCVACTVIKGFKLDWGNGFAEFAILGMFGWLMVGLYRLVWCSWLAVRPEPKAVIRSAAEYANPEDAFDAAFQLDMRGDWDAAIALYGDVARRWPEHEHYVQGCITHVEEKRSRL